MYSAVLSKYIVTLSFVTDVFDPFGINSIVLLPI